MLAFVLRRLLQSVIVMTVVAYIAFGLFNYVGDPVAFMLGQDVTLQEMRIEAFFPADPGTEARAREMRARRGRPSQARIRRPSSWHCRSRSDTSRRS